jgi:hypothetical protein
MKTRSWTISVAAWVVVIVLAAAWGMTVESLAIARASASGQTDVKGASVDDTKLEIRQPVSCVGSQVVELTGVLVRTDAVAISVAGGCEVRIKDSHIVGHIALLTAGGTVTIENTIIEGGRFAFRLAGDSNVSIRSSTVRGEVQRAGGSFKDLGNNVFR